ncbi:hypothetical protein LguiB_024089 [Lonicera macranthoides]
MEVDAFNSLAQAFTFKDGVPIPRVWVLASTNIGGSTVDSSVHRHSAMADLLNYQTKMGMVREKVEVMLCAGTLGSPHFRLQV